jgi:predicted nucleic acid-binding protein
MTFKAVVDSSTLIALVRGNVLAPLGKVCQPLIIGSRAEIECRKRPFVDAALNQAQAAGTIQLSVITLNARSRAYDPNLTEADIEGIEIALAQSAPLLTQDELQRVEAYNVGVQGVLHTFNLLDGFKRQGFIPLVRPVLELMLQNGENYPKLAINNFLRRVNEPIFP